MSTYSIRGWSDHFETSQSRRCKALHWISIPNKFDGDRISELIERGGDSAYGAFVAAVLVASRCETRGTLVRSTGTPHTPKTLHRQTGLSEDSFVRMLQLATEIGLIDRVDSDSERAPSGLGADRVLNARHKTIQDSTGQHTSDATRRRSGDQLGEPEETKAGDQDRREPTENARSCVPSDQAGNQSPENKTRENGSPAPNRRRAIWRAVCACWGLNPETKRERADVGDIVADLAIKIGDDPIPLDVIRRRRKAYRAKFPTAADTPRAVLKHWDYLKPAKEAAPISSAWTNGAKIEPLTAEQREEAARVRRQSNPFATDQAQTIPDFDRQEGAR